MGYSRARLGIALSAAGAALAAGAVAAPAAPAAEPPACDSNALSTSYQSWMGTLSTGNPPRQDGDIWYWRLENANLYCKAGVTGPHWVKGAIRDRYLQEGEYATFGVPDKDETDAAGGGKHNTFTGVTVGPAPNAGPSGIYWKPDTGARSIIGQVFREWAAAGFEGGRYGYPTSSTITSGAALLNHFQGSDRHGATLVYRKPSGHGVFGTIRDRWIATGGLDYCGVPTTGEQPTEYGAVSLFDHGRIDWYRSSNTAVDQCNPAA